MMQWKPIKERKPSKAFNALDPVDSYEWFWAYIVQKEECADYKVGHVYLLKIYEHADHGYCNTEGSLKSRGMEVIYWMEDACGCGTGWHCNDARRKFWNSMRRPC